MKTALVFGGTRFFGVNLVKALLSKGVTVTVATRQNSEVPFDKNVDTLKVDRLDFESVNEAVRGRTWDMVFDQICYNARDAKIAVQALHGKTRKYIFTSTMSVYDFAENVSEADFNPYTYPISDTPPDQVTYQEGKRQAEAVLFQMADFPVIAVRIPIVLGEQDYTERLLLHINRTKDGSVIGFPNLLAKMGFIHQEEAGHFLAWISEQDFSGPINACSNEIISMAELMALIECEVGRKPSLPSTFDPSEHSPYGVENTWNMSNVKARELGYRFSTLNDWLPGLIKHLAN
ncbi:NAD-dependent epimerase/dehydratase family protein [Robertmurraya korlensis]|uniref:NAD-dependent epimerase/dehydratase family protein n=1 Tax=Robertmurraya korlensis TaxID=519977 RepID=UPI0008254E26|nr:NAD-dependent epimerase/dehydratase family protein [Robertmurraya korlensis]